MTQTEFCRGYAISLRYLAWFDLIERSARCRSCALNRRFGMTSSRPRWRLCGQPMSLRHFYLVTDLPSHERAITITAWTALAATAN
jgi:hypothetical protein